MVPHMFKTLFYSFTVLVVFFCQITEIDFNGSPCVSQFHSFGCFLLSNLNSLAAEIER